MIELATILVSEVEARVVDLKPIPAKIAGGTVHIIYDDPMWDKLTKNAVFVGSKAVTVLGIGDVVEIPVDAVAHPGKLLKIGICGTTADGKTMIPTVYANLGQVRPAADPDADPSTDPGLPVWAQLQAEIEQLKQDGPDVDLSGYVKSVNGKAPDENGNVEIAVPDSGGNANQSGGMSATASALLITILRNAVYSTDQSANITALEAALATGGEEVPDAPETGVEQFGSILSIVSGVTVSQSDSVLAIA